jgi:hypothetical protein
MMFSASVLCDLNNLGYQARMDVALMEVAEKGELGVSTLPAELASVEPGHPGRHGNWRR